MNHGNVQLDHSEVSRAVDRVAAAGFAHCCTNCAHARIIHASITRTLSTREFAHADVVNLLAGVNAKSNFIDLVQVQIHFRET